MERIEWSNEKRKVSELIPWEKNPRKITDEQLAHLKRSIERFGYAAPVVVNADGTIVAGHMRTRAMIALGMGETEVDVRVPSRPLTDEELTELAVRDNANGGDWDFKKLMDFDLEALADWGFDPDKVDRIRNRVKEDEFDAEKRVKEILEPKTSPGTLYELGRHRLLCADASIVHSYERLMGGGVAKLVFTDPPYGVNYQSDAQGSIKNDDMDRGQLQSFFEEVLARLYDFTSEDACLYWWFADRMNWVNRLAWMAQGWEMSHVLIWLKETMIFSIGKDYHRCYEPCMFGWKKGHAHFRNKKITNFRDVWMMDETDFGEMPDVWYQNRDKAGDYIHPTQKPVRLAERAIRKNSAPGDIVLDVFGGSGSTIMACEQMDRRCFAMELDPKFCDAIVERWEAFTGKKAVVRDA